MSWIDELLEGSLKLLDVCSVAKHCLLQSKESMYELELVIHKRGAETAFTIKGGKYLASRKNLNKAIRKALGNLNGIEREQIVTSLNKDSETLAMLSILKEAEVITVNSLESLLLFIIGSKGQPKHSRWSVISKLMQPNKEECYSQESDTNAFEKVDADLQSLINHKPSFIEDFQSHMEILEMCIQNLDVGVEHLSGKLVRTRVSLLNFFNH